MTVLRRYMNQTVSFEQRTAEGSRGAHTYADPVNIAALYEPNFGTVTTQSGATTQAESRVVTTVELALGDKIEGYEIKRVDPVIEHDGTIAEWEAFL